MERIQVFAWMLELVRVSDRSETQMLISYYPARSNGSPMTVTPCVTGKASQLWEWNKDKQLVIATTSES